MDTPIQVDLGRIAQDLQIRRVQVESVVALLDEGNTVPFITRYRKERTGNLNELAIREIQLRVGRLRDLAERKETILKSIEAQGKLTDELRDAIRGADNPKRLEDLYLPYKPKKKTKASEARDKGLEPLALRIWNRDETLTDLPAAAAELLNPERELDTPEKVLEGVGHILAEAISEMAAVRDSVRRAVWKTGKIGTTKAENLPEGQGIEYRDYFAYSEPINHIPPHRVLAINRGDKEGPLKVKLDVPRQDLERALFTQLPLEGHPQGEFFTNAAIDALDRLLFPSLEREVRRDLTDMAERHAVDVFARNLRSLLLQPPIQAQAVLAIDPGFRTGCKVAVTDATGNLIEHTVIHPHQPQNRRHEAKMVLKDLVGKHKIGVIAIGNGTASRETEEFVAEIIAEGTFFHTHPGETVMPTVSRSAPRTEESPAAEPAPAAEGAMAPAESPAAPEPEATPGPEAAAPSTEESNHEASSNGDATAEEPSGSVESLPPLSGGAPADPEEPKEGTPPASSAPEAESPDSERKSADHLASNEATRNPARTDDDKKDHDKSSLPPIRGGSTDEPSPAEEATAETPNETVPPPSPAEPETAPAEASAAEGATAAVPTPEDSAAEGDSVPTPEITAETPAEGATAAVPTPEDSAAEGDSAPASPPMSAPNVAAGDESEGEPATPPSPAFTAPPVGTKPKPEKERDKEKGEAHPPKPQKPKGPPPAPKPHASDPLLAQLSYVIVNEAGASVYSASPVGRDEFPDLDATTRGTISIARRLQDPLAELVKIEPQSIGVGLYQHDVNPKQLKETLETVIESCVNFVGVDVNTASVPLLRHVSGLNALTAKRIADYRKEHGPFTSRDQIKEIDGVGPATFTQAAGFLKIRDSGHPFDRTWIHPESYATAEALLQKLEFTPDVVKDREQLPALHAKLDETDFAALAKDLNVGEPTLRDIADALARPDRDPREDLPKPIFKKGVLKLEDLSPGMELKGTVLNVVDFGAFVDIGLKDSGLVHISQLANRYIKSPHDVVSVGDVVTAWVMGVDNERKRVSLTMVEPGTERPRVPGEGGGGGRRGRGGEGAGEGRGPRSGGGERRGGGRPPLRPGQPQGEGQAAAPQGAASGEGGGPPRGGPRPGGGGRGPQNRSGPGGSFGRSGGGGGRPGGGQGGGARFERATLPPRPAKPAPPPPPLSKDALQGNVPLRSFGQLKQLFEARVSPPEGETPASETSAPPQSEPSPSPQPESDQSSN